MDLCGNTNLKGSQKTGIQIGGATGSTVVGFFPGFALMAGVKMSAIGGPKAFDAGALLV